MCVCVSIYIYMFIYLFICLSVETCWPKKELAATLADVCFNAEIKHVQKK